MYNHHQFRAETVNGPRVRWLWSAGAGLLMACVSVLAACKLGSTPTPIPTATPTATPTLVPTPTPTPEPLAGQVNGWPIKLAEYEKEVERCQLGKDSLSLDSATCPAEAWQSLVEQAVVEQAARFAGLTVTEAEVEAARAQILTDLGSPETYTAWLAANLYTDEEFRQVLQRELLRQRQAEQITAGIGPQAEQVHAQAILVTDPALAQNLLDQLKNGEDFSKLALAYSQDLNSRVAGGDLGWFPRGLLTAPEVEQAAFALQPGEISAVVQSALGYHIVQTLEYDPARPLSPTASEALCAHAYQAWLDRLLAEAQIVSLVTP